MQCNASIQVIQLLINVNCVSAMSSSETTIGHCYTMPPSVLLLIWCSGGKLPVEWSRQHAIQFILCLEMSMEATQPSSSQSRKSFQLVSWIIMPSIIPTVASYYLSTKIATFAEVKRSRRESSWRGRCLTIVSGEVERQQQLLCEVSLKKDLSGKQRSFVIGKVRPTLDKIVEQTQRRLHSKHTLQASRHRILVGWMRRLIS